MFSQMGCWLKCKSQKISNRSPSISIDRVLNFRFTFLALLSSAYTWSIRLDISDSGLVDDFRAAPPHKLGWGRLITNSLSLSRKVLNVFSDKVGRCFLLIGSSNPRHILICSSETIEIKTSVGCGCLSK